MRKFLISPAGRRHRRKGQNMKHLIWFGALVAMMVGVTACNATPGSTTPASPGSTTSASVAPESAAAASPSGKQVVIGYSGPAPVGAQKQIQDGLVAGAEKKGWKVVVTLSGGDANKALNDIKDLIAQGVNAVVAVPDDSVSICQAVAMAKAANVPFYTIDRSVSGCKVNMTILSDNYLAGKQSGEAIVAFLTQRYGSPKGKVLEITGDLAQNVTLLRGGGFNDVMKKNPNITVITKVGNWDAAKAVQIVQDVASTQADLDAIYMQSDCTYGPGVLQTLAGLGKTAKAGQPGHIFISGVDGCKTTLDSIRDGSMDQSSSQPIPDFGAVLADYIEQELNGKPVGPGAVIKEGASWSPARIETSDVGPQLFMSTTSVGKANVADPNLWGNK